MEIDVELEAVERIEVSLKGRILKKETRQEHDIYLEAVQGYKKTRFAGQPTRSSIVPATITNVAEIRNNSSQKG